MLTVAKWVYLLQATSRPAAKQQQVYLDLSVDGEPKGRLVIELSGDAPVGTQRFVELSQGLNGVGYRLSKFDGIAQVLLITLHHTHVEVKRFNCVQMDLHTVLQNAKRLFFACCPQKFSILPFAASIRLH